MNCHYMEMVNRVESLEFSLLALILENEKCYNRNKINHLINKIGWKKSMCKRLITYQINHNLINNVNYLLLQRVEYTFSYLFPIY